VDSLHFTATLNKKIINLKEEKDHLEHSVIVVGGCKRACMQCYARTFQSTMPSWPALARKVPAGLNRTTLQLAE
jgi:DNA repair photolyase